MTCSCFFFMLLVQSNIGLIELVQQLYFRIDNLKENNECVYFRGWNDDKSQDDMNKWECSKDN